MGGPAWHWTGHFVGNTIGLRALGPARRGMLLTQFQPDADTQE